MLTRLKKKFQNWIRSEAKIAHKVGLTPNQISALGLIFAVLSAIFYWRWDQVQLSLVMAPILLLLSGFCDALDGALARSYGETSPFGPFLDSTLDRIADATILCGIIFGELCHPFWGFVTLTGSLMVSYTRARAEALGVGMETVGMAERAERLLLLAMASFVSILWLEVLNWAVILLAILTTFTVLQRVLHFLKWVKTKRIDA